MVTKLYNDFSYLCAGIGGNRRRSDRPELFPPICILDYPRSLRLTIDTSLTTSARSCLVMQERAPSKLGQRAGASE